MARLYLLLFLAQIVLAVCALISCLSTEESEIRALPRIVWVLIILFFPLIGSIAWFAVGRPAQSGQRPGVWRPGSGFPESKRPRRPLAPDDDPDFLASLDKGDSHRLERWEADLRRRERELRDRDPAGREQRDGDGGQDPEPGPGDDTPRPGDGPPRR